MQNDRLEEIFPSLNGLKKRPNNFKDGGMLKLALLYFLEHTLG